MEIKVSGQTLTNINQINILLGKNGCGKSSLLRLIDSNRNHLASEFPIIKYISPERGGNLLYDSGVDQNIQNNPEWLTNTRRRNLDDNFRQKSMTQLRSLEALINRTILNDKNKRYHTEESFEDTLTLINNLLDNVIVSFGDKLTPIIKGKHDGKIRNSEELSSGEKELVCLAIEVLAFAYEVEIGKYAQRNCLLLIDSPEVHLHADLQHRLMELLLKVIKDKPISVLIATHDTAILGALNQNSASVYFMPRQSQETITFIPVGTSINCQIRAMKEALSFSMHHSS